MYDIYAKLIKYCKNGDQENIRKIFNDNDSNVLLPIFLNKNGKALRTACYYRHLVMVKLMMDKCQELGLDNFKIHEILKYKQYSCLSSTTTLYSEFSQLEVVKYLVEKIKETSGDPRIMISVLQNTKYEAVMSACKNGDLLLTKYLALEYNPGKPKCNRDIAYVLTRGNKKYDCNTGVYFSICSMNMDLIKYTVRKVKVKYQDRLDEEISLGLYQILFNNIKVSEYFKVENNQNKSWGQCLKELKPMLDEKTYEIFSYLIKEDKN
jgi:hypothetical protein